MSIREKALFKFEYTDAYFKPINNIWMEWDMDRLIVGSSEKQNWQWRKFNQQT